MKSVLLLFVLVGCGGDLVMPFGNEHGAGGSASGGSATGGNGLGGSASDGVGGKGGVSSIGAGGAPAGIGPCAGLCADPTTGLTGALGTGAICQEVLGMYKGVYCPNFIHPRTLSVNGVDVACIGGTVDLPPTRNGGYCMQASAGENSSATYAFY